MKPFRKDPVIFKWSWTMSCFVVVRPSAAVWLSWLILPKYIKYMLNQRKRFIGCLVIHARCVIVFCFVSFPLFVFDKVCTWSVRGMRIWHTGILDTKWSGFCRRHFKVCSIWSNRGVLCQKQVSRAGTSNYIPQNLWDVITCRCPWYLVLLAQNSLTDNVS